MRRVVAGVWGERGEGEVENPLVIIDAFAGVSFVSAVMMMTMLLILPLPYVVSVANTYVFVDASLIR